MRRAGGASPRGIASREAILKAAVRVIGREGLSGASLSAVAAEAGTSKPAVLYHFGSRDKLLREVAGTAITVYRKLIHPPEDMGLAPKERTASSVAALFDPGNRTLLVCMHELVGLGMRDPEVAAMMRRSLDEAALGAAQGMSKLELERAVELARALIMAVHGHVELWLCSGDADPKPFIESATRSAMAIVQASARA